MPLLTNLLVVFAVLGIIISFHLIKSRLAKKKLICPINENCNDVTESKYSRILYINNDILGIIYYLFILLISLYLIFFTNVIILNILFLTKVITGIAVLFSIVLFFIQVKIIKNYCSYCLTTYLINIIIFVIFLLL